MMGKSGLTSVDRTVHGRQGVWRVRLGTRLGVVQLFVGPQLSVVQLYYNCFVVVNGDVLLKMAVVS